MRRRFVQINGELHEVSLDYTQETRSDYHIMPDIKPYKSMVDGKVIGSRSTHREHLRDHRLVEVGNETNYIINKAKQPLQSPPGLKEDLIAAAHKLRR